MHRSLIGGLVVVSDGQVLMGLTLGVAGIVSAVTLLALGHVGRAIIDIAVNTGTAVQSQSELRHVLTQAQVPASARAPVQPSEPARPLGVAAPDPSPASVARKWRVLKEVDGEIAEAAARMATFGPRFEEEFAEKFMTLGDKAYLRRIEEVVTAQVNEERNTWDRIAQGFGPDTPESSFAELRTYLEVLRANERMDPGLRRRVEKIEPYKGSWASADGGIRITLDDGATILRKGYFARHFVGDPEALHAASAQTFNAPSQRPVFDRN